MQPLSKIIKAAYTERTDWENSVHQFLYSYRNTPHSVTQVPPAELTFSIPFSIFDTIPDISSNTDKNVAEEVEQSDQRIKKSSKRYQDQTQQVQKRTINIDDRVVAKQQKRNKLIPTFSQYLYVVGNVKGSMKKVFNKDTGSTVTRNISFFKVIPVVGKAPRARIVIKRVEGVHRLSQVPQEKTQQPRETQQPIEARQTTPRKVYPNRI